jgi:hypothetical protein
LAFEALGCYLHWIDRIRVINPLSIHLRMTVRDIKEKQYERFSTAVPDTTARHYIRMAGYLLVTEEELIELFKNNTDGTS